MKSHKHIYVHDQFLLTCDQEFICLLEGHLFIPAIGNFTINTIISINQTDN